MKVERSGAARLLRVDVLPRVVLLALCGAVAAARDPWPHLLWVLPLAAVGAAAVAAGRSRTSLVVATCLEGLLAGAAVAGTGFGDSPYLPYLLAPAFTGGLAAGLVGGVPPIGAASAVLLLAPLVVADAPAAGELSSVTAQWVVLSVFLATVATWVRSLLFAPPVQPDPQVAQQEAFRLLTELRNVARRMPGSLDPATTAEVMLDRAREACRFDTGALLVATPGGAQLAVAARSGAERPEWDLSLSADSTLADAWATQQTQVRGERVPTRTGHRPAGSSMVVPLVADGRTFGLLVLENGVAQGFSAEAAAAVEREVQALGLQLRTGLVFDEVRELATHEERRRLAREIHDGIAQELASLGYVLDNLAADVADAGLSEDGVGQQVEQVRTEVRRLVTELRMSLFDLRADVDPAEGLGAAISRHLRTVGTASGMTIHLSLNESPLRLAAETEAQVLRIVQESVTNARKHAQARNLWVSCTVDPPHACVTVEDDGRGLSGEPAASSHGLQIMQERAHRIRGRLTVTGREPSGTRVELRIGTVRA